MSNEDEARVWETGWDGHSDQQLRRLARLSLAEKLRWLEEADRVARSLAGGHADRNDREKAERLD